MNVLIIEDDPDITELLSYHLKQERFSSQACANGALGLDQARKDPPSLILLDLMLPDKGGLEICRELKSDPRTKEIPIIILTAKGEETDRIVGFEVGADDYLPKPFSPRELMLRIKAVLKRQSRKEPSQESIWPFHVGTLHVDPDRFQVLVGKTEVRLTAREFKLLKYLISHQGDVVSRSILLDKVWGYEAPLETRTIDTHIKRLREKLGKMGHYVETIRGVGYRFKDSLTI